MNLINAIKYEGCGRYRTGRVATPQVDRMDRVIGKYQRIVGSVVEVVLFYACGKRFVDEQCRGLAPGIHISFKNSHRVGSMPDRARN